MIHHLWNALTYVYRSCKTAFFWRKWVCRFHFRRLVKSRSQKNWENYIDFSWGLYGIKWWKTFLISNFHRLLNVVCFLMGNSQASEFYMPTFRNTLSFPSSYADRYLSGYGDGTERSAKSAYKIQTPGNYPEKAYNIMQKTLRVTVFRQ